MVTTICWVQQKKKNGSSKKDNKDGKALYTLMNNPVYGKTMKNLKNRINVKLAMNYLNVSNKDYLRWTLKLSYLNHKIFHNDLVAIRKTKLTLTLNKPA